MKRCLLCGRKAMSNPDSALKSRDITLPTKVRIVKAMVIPSSHGWMGDLDHKEGWAPNNWCFQIVILEKTLKNPLDCKEIKPVYPKGNQPWIFTGRTDAEGWSSNNLATFCEEVTRWKRSWCWQRLKAGGEGDTRGWDGWMASLTQRIWVWANSGKWWWTGKPGVLQPRQSNMTEQVNSNKL